MVNELSRQQRKVLIFLVVAILLGAGRLGFQAFSRGTVEVHLVKPVTVAWPGITPEQPGREQETSLLTLATPQQDEKDPPEGAAKESAENNEALPSPPKSAAKDPAVKRLNPNIATNEELQTLPGIGPVLADRIIEYRETVGKFQTIDDLLAVKGIGEKTLAKIRPYLEL